MYVYEYYAGNRTEPTCMNLVGCLYNVRHVSSDVCMTVASIHTQRESVHNLLFPPLAHLPSTQYLVHTALCKLTLHASLVQGNPTG